MCCFLFSYLKICLLYYIILYYIILYYYNIILYGWSSIVIVQKTIDMGNRWQ